MYLLNREIIEITPIIMKGVSAVSKQILQATAHYAVLVADSFMVCIAGDS